MAHTYTTLATILALMVTFWTFARCGSARGKLDVKAPATTGNELFERAFRVHQNTTEQLVMFLPSMWLFWTVAGDLVAGGLGLIWVIGRVLYCIAYVKEPKSRLPGMLLTTLPLVVCLGGSLVAWLMAMLGLLG